MTKAQSYAEGKWAGLRKARDLLQDVWAGIDKYCPSEPEKDGMNYALSTLEAEIHHAEKEVHVDPEKVEEEENAIENERNTTHMHAYQEGFAHGRMMERNKIEDEIKKRGNRNVLNNRLLLTQIQKDVAEIKRLFY